ncbi:MAG: glycosyl transferase family 2 [Elusimicrobia bacterium RIFCSPLOWO2_12_FULL_59_9]|nr:MAG: glycosyl transferase family 2 [Elusimicrobia bacterium RIFCSPLOWO2_12_FULL_59_9]
MKVIAVLPAYNAEKTLEKTVGDIPPGVVDEVILVDDASEDRTVEISRRLGLITLRHETNRGYGANQKTCYRQALDRGADIVVMIHPDYQYDARLTPYLVGLIQNDICDFVLGNRIRTRREALRGGMPPYKYFANRGLTVLENFWTGQNLGEWHSGLRVYSRKVLETVPWRKNSDDFVFDQQMLIQAAHFDFRIGDIPASARYFAEASSIGFKRSVVYGLSTLGVLWRYRLHRMGVFNYPILIADPDKSS